MAELDGQEAARDAMVAAWPHMTESGRRSTLRSWLGADAAPARDSAFTVERGPALDAFIGAP